MEWISVEDRIPDEDVAVLFYVAGQLGGIEYGHRIGKWWYGLDLLQRWGIAQPDIDDLQGSVAGHKNVTHWMPLPLPPSAEP